MAWRTVVISNPAKLKIEHNQLLVVQNEAIPLPVDDIGVLVLESPEVALSSSLLYRLSQAGVLLLVCDEKHLPCMVGLPYAGHSRLAGAQRLQLSLSLPFKKRCWQSVVRSKVENQAECLTLADRPNAAKLRILLPLVTSGDTTNVEARAARLYFGSLFGDNFIRDDDTPINAALNYGYAIIRAAVARALAAHGLLLSQGIHHRSELNAFNLVDDFLEPFRPVVDLWVAHNITDDMVFERSHRQMLVSLLASEASIDGKRQSVSRSAEIMASSFVTACREKSAAALKLPEVLPLGEHLYE